MEKLNQFNDQLMGAPAGILLFLAIIAIGYALKSAKYFPNNLIPVILMFFGVFLWLLIAPEDEKLSRRVWWGRNILVGLIIPCASWLAHKIVLKRIERKLGLFDKSFDTEEFSKPQNEKTNETKNPTIGS